MRVIYFDVDCTRPDHLVERLEYLGRQDQIEDLRRRLQSYRRWSPHPYPASRY